MEPEKKLVAVKINPSDADYPYYNEDESVKDFDNKFVEYVSALYGIKGRVAIMRFHYATKEFLHESNPELVYLDLAREASRYTIDGIAYTLGLIAIEGELEEDQI